MEIKKAKELLVSGGHTCVLYKDGQVYTSDLRGVKPLVAWYEADMDFSDFSAADKVVGKATAFLYRMFCVKAVYAGVISRPALAVLKDADIAVEYDELAEHIINRSGDGICPFEAAVLDINDEKVAYTAIREKMKEMNITIQMEE